MRGEDERSGSLFSYVDLEARVGQSHPLRIIRALVNEALAALASDFSALYSPIRFIAHLAPGQWSASSPSMFLLTIC